MDESVSNILSALINKSDGNFFGGNNGSGIWVLFLFFMMFAWGGNGGFYGNNAAAFANYATQSDVLQGLNTQTITTDLQGIAQSINTVGYNALNLASDVNQNVSQQGFNIQTSVLQGNNALQMAICQGNSGLQYAIADKASDITQGINNAGNNIVTAINGTGNNLLRAVDNNRFESAQQTCAIQQTSTANTQAILDKLCSMELLHQQEKNAEKDSIIATLQGQLAMAIQTQNIIGALAPTPRPSYIVSSPYATTPTNGLVVS